MNRDNAWKDGYDAWKTTDPRELEDQPEQEELDELEQAYDRIKALEHAAKQNTAELVNARSRIKTLEADLAEVLPFLEKHYDVVDGGNGEPAPNQAMRLGNMIEFTLRSKQR